MDDRDVPHLKKTFLSGLHHLIPIFVLIYSTCLYEIHSRLFNFLCNLSLILVNLINRLLKNSDYKTGLKIGIIKQLLVFKKVQSIW